MPERDLEVDAASMLVEWGSIRLIGPGRLRLTSEVIALDVTGGAWEAFYHELRGASWPLPRARRGSGGAAGRLGAASPSRSARPRPRRYAACLRAVAGRTRQIAEPDA